MMIQTEYRTTLFVSQQNGNDENNGFAPKKDGTDAPLKTIEAALDVVKDLRARGYMQPICVKITDEEYFVEKPVIIDEAISAITIEPYEKTRISGGMRLTGFQADTFNGTDCISAYIPAVKEGRLWFTDLYVNGVAAAFTQYPKDGFLYAKDVENPSTNLHSHSKWFIAEAADLETIKTFKNFSDCFISYNHYWIDEHTPIESYDEKSGKIVFKYASRFSIEPTHEASKLRYKLENVAECFQNPGEWYLERPTGKVYYIPRAGESIDTLQVYAPIAEKLFAVQGKVDKKVQGICLRGLELNCTKGDYRSRYMDKDPKENIYVYDDAAEGFASDIQSVCWAHGSIEFSYAHGCSVENCRIVNMGVHAICIGEGADTICLTGNEITQTGAGAIKIDGGDASAPPAMQTHTLRITNNQISFCGNRYFAACGILLKHAHTADISHNEIHDLYYSGISCGWVWGYAASVTRDIRIEKNHIHHLGKGKLSDMGGIYLLGKQPGTIVSGNLIHDVESKHYGGWGLYTDEGSSYITLENNICYNLTSNGYHQHYGSYNTVRNNIFVQSKKAPAALTRGEAHIGLLFENNILISENTPSFSVSGAAGHGPLGKHFVSMRNILFDRQMNAPAFLVFKDEDVYTLKQAQEELGMDAGSIVCDPMFSDLDGHKFTLAADSPALKLGFKQIDMSDVGVQK